METEETQNHIQLFCDEFGANCNLNIEMAKFLLNSQVLQSCTITEKGDPYIYPIMYLYEMNLCSIIFLIEKESKLKHNITRNPFVSFSTDNSNQIDPLQNSGIMVKSYARIRNDKKTILTCLERFRRKYSSHLVPEQVEAYADQFDLYVEALIFRIIYWKGPFYKYFICQNRELVLANVKSTLYT